jgi:hypothetical protein
VDRQDSLSPTDHRVDVVGAATARCTCGYRKDWPTRREAWADAVVHVMPIRERYVTRVDNLASQRPGTTRYLDPAPLLAALGDVVAAVAGERLGVARQTVMRWRTGRHQVRARDAERYAAALGLTLGEIWPEYESPAIKTAPAPPPAPWPRPTG